MSFPRAIVQSSRFHFTLFPLLLMMLVGGCRSSESRTDYYNPHVFEDAASTYPPTDSNRYGDPHVPPTPSVDTDLTEPGWIDRAKRSAARIADGSAGLLRRLPRVPQLVNPYASEPEDSTPDESPFNENGSTSPALPPIPQVQPRMKEAPRPKAPPVETVSHGPVA